MMVMGGYCESMLLLVVQMLLILILNLLKVVENLSDLLLVG